MQGSRNLIRRIKIILTPLAPRIWIAVEGKTLRIIEDGTMELVLEKKQNPEKEFIEIEKVEVR